MRNALESWKLLKNYLKDDFTDEEIEHSEIINSIEAAVKLGVEQQNKQQITNKAAVKKEENIRKLKRILRTLRDKVVNIDELLYYDNAEGYNFSLHEDLQLTDAQFSELKNYFSGLDD